MLKKAGSPARKGCGFMLKGIPPILCPELLKTLDEMGHNDLLVIGDGNFPGSGVARAGGARLIRADGIGAAELLAAILQVMPLDEYVPTPVTLIEKEALDKDLATPIWDQFAQIVARHDPRGVNAIGRIARMDFYRQAQAAYAIVQTTESALYGCLMLRKGVIRP